MYDSATSLIKKLHLIIIQLINRIKKWISFIRLNQLNSSKKGKKRSDSWVFEPTIPFEGQSNLLSEFYDCATSPVKKATKLIIYIRPNQPNYSNSN